MGTKITKSDLFFIKTVFMILITLLGFLVGYVVGITRFQNTTEKSVQPQIRIVPDNSPKSLEQFITLKCNNTQERGGIYYER